MQSDSNNLTPAVELRASNSYDRSLKALRKRYRKVDSDIKKVVEDLRCGIFNGNVIPGVNLKCRKIYKLRIINTELNKGKSNGYRLIYCVEELEDCSSFRVFLLYLYCKAIQSDISVKDIKLILEDIFSEINNEDLESDN